MTAAEILKQLKSLGSDSYKKTLLKHGVQEPIYGVKIEELKKIQKRVKHDYQLALELFDSGNYDAQYLAGLIADDKKMTPKDLRRWMKTANCAAITNYTVAWVAAESLHGRELALDWIDAKADRVISGGWSTLSSWVAIADDSKLDLKELQKLLQRIRQTIHKSPDGARYSMNGFVIAVGSYVRELTNVALDVAEKIGQVTVDMGDTACQVPYAPDYIRKVQQRGAIGKKRKSAKC